MYSNIEIQERLTYIYMKFYLLPEAIVSHEP